MSGAPRDPGLQPERTRLAWRRTTLSCTVVALLAGRQALHGGAGAGAGEGIAAALSAVAWLGFLWVAHRRVAGMDSTQPQPLSPRGALAATVCTVALAVFAAATLF